MESLREVERAEAVAMAEVIPEILLVLETSAKENTNVEQCFVELATELKVIVVKYFVLQYVYYMIFKKFYSESTEWWWSCGFRTSWNIDSEWYKSSSKFPPVFWLCLALNTYYSDLGSLTLC